MKLVRKIICVVIVFIFSMQLVACGVYQDIFPQLEGFDSILNESSSDNQGADELESEANQNMDNDIEMSDNLFDFTVKLDGVVIQIPCTSQKLTDMGWKFYDVDKNTMIAGKSYEATFMNKGDKKIYVYFYNMSGNACELADCKVGGFSLEISDDIPIELSNGITLESEVDEIIAAYGTPSERTTYDDYEILDYRQNDSYYNRVEFQCYKTEEDKKYTSVEIKNFVETTEEQTETNTKRPEYLDDYVRPTTLGTDLISGNISLEGDLYHLPAPLSEFIAQGWTIVQQPGGISSGNRDYIRIKKGDKELGVDIINYAEYQTTAENCVVYSISEYDSSEIDLQLPNISFASGKADVERNITEEFDCYENTDSDSYSYSEYKERDFYISITVDRKMGKVSYISLNSKTWDY